MSDVADKLREARALIERGWTQGSFVSADEKRYCADGALCWTAGTGEYGPMLDTFKAAIGAETYADIWSWNDASERTQAEVLAAFDKAIELAEAQS